MFQSQVLDILQDFGVGSPSDYRRLSPGTKPYFLNRLYKAFDESTHETLDDLAAAGGVKLHFATAPDLTAPRPNLPNEVFLKKASFYANCTLITFPFREVKSKADLRILQDRPKHHWPNTLKGKDMAMYFGEVESGGRAPAGGGRLVIRGKVYTVDAAALDDLITLTASMRPAIEAGIARVLPAYPDTERQFKRRKYGLTSANFDLPELKHQFSESALAARRSPRGFSGLSHLLLPHFDDVPMERVLEIREKEADSYWEFQRRLEELLRGASQTDSEQRILGFLREVDLGVRELHGRFKDVQNRYRRRSVHLALKFMAAGLMLMSPLEPAVKSSLATVLSGFSAFDYLTLRQDRAEELADARRDHFYLPWLVFKSAKKPRG